MNRKEQLFSSHWFSKSLCKVCRILREHSFRWILHSRIDKQPRRPLSIAYYELLHTPTPSIPLSKYKSCKYFSQVFKLHLMVASQKIAHETAICRNPHNVSNWESRITRHSDYKYIYLLHRVPSHTAPQPTQLGYRFRLDINHWKTSSLGTMVLKEEASWWHIKPKLVTDLSCAVMLCVTALCEINFRLTSTTGMIINVGQLLALFYVIKIFIYLR